MNTQSPSIKVKYSFQRHDDHVSVDDDSMLGERAKYWLTIFDPADGPKDYQSRLANRAEMAEYRLEKALALLDQHKIDHDIVMPI